MRVGEHFVHRVTDCTEGNQSRLLSAQNVPLRTKCPVTCDRPWGATGQVVVPGRVSCGRLGYLWATWAAHAGRTEDDTACTGYAPRRSGPYTQARGTGSPALMVGS